MRAVAVAAENKTHRDLPHPEESFGQVRSEGAPTNSQLGAPRRWGETLLAPSTLTRAMLPTAGAVDARYGVPKPMWGGRPTAAKILAVNAPPEDPLVGRRPPSSCFPRRTISSFVQFSTVELKEIPASRDSLESFASRYELLPTIFFPVQIMQSAGSCECGEDQQYFFRTSA